MELLTLVLSLGLLSLVGLGVASEYYDFRLRFVFEFTVKESPTVDDVHID